ncbi:hypothetical protein [Candidatus Leptofilum sp.]|uniref:hypothetical protein n=1 Tax=Candidatus Leptofilum sp. TaxID=3241576 RepID=UPI003B5A9DCA
MNQLGSDVSPILGERRVKVQIFYKNLGVRVETAVKKAGHLHDQLQNSLCVY